MEGHGFIHSKLDIKLLILYICARIPEPLPLHAVQELTLCDDGINYFDFAESLAELVESEHLRLDDRQCYAITEKGIRNGHTCESSLPYSVRLQVDKTIAAYNQMLRRQAQVQGNISRRGNGSYTVQLSLSDDSGSLLKLELMSPTEQAAQIMLRQFHKSPEQLYHRIVEHLLNDSDPSQANG